MVSTLTLSASLPNLSLSSSSSSYYAALTTVPFSHTSTAFTRTKHGFPNPRIKLFTSTSKPRLLSVSASASSSPLQALTFDCDGVILESEDLHRRAYNDAFAHFNVRCPSSTEPLNWRSEFYDEFQNLVGGGKPKLRWYFKEHGWPSSTVFKTPPNYDENREKLIDILQAKPRPAVLRLMDETKKSGKKLAVCSAGTKSSVIFCLENLTGIEGFQNLDCFLAGDDVKEKKPNPSIDTTASKKLGLSPQDCLVIEDSVIGLQAATKAGMACVIAYASSTANQDNTEEEIMNFVEQQVERLTPRKCRRTYIERNRKEGHA